MTTITRRMLTSIALAAGVAAPVVGGMAVAAADQVQMPSTGSSVSVPGDKKTDDDKDKDKKDNDDKDKDDKKASVDAAQKVLASIGDAKKPEDLSKKLDDDIKALADNESAIPSKVKDEYKAFEKTLADAKSKKSLDGMAGWVTLKLIQTDAAKLAGNLKAAAS